MDDTPEQDLAGYQTLGREGSTLYYTDGTHYGQAVQVWELRHGTRSKYCLLSGWQESAAYKRIKHDGTYGRPRRSLYDEYGANVFGDKVTRGYSL